MNKLVDHRLTVIETSRTRLRSWVDADGAAFAALHSHPEVTSDLGGPFSRARSDAKLNRYIGAFTRYGFSRWALEAREGKFLGCVGVMPGPENHPLGRHFEIGWRLVRDAWGCGYAAESAKAALVDVFDRVGLPEVVSYTAADNTRSQAVMPRLGLVRDPARDFTAVYEGVGSWRGLVWVAKRK